MASDRAFFFFFLLGDGIVLACGLLCRRPFVIVCFGSGFLLFVVNNRVLTLYL